MYKITANDWDGMACNRVSLSVRKTEMTNRKMTVVAEKYASKGRSNPSSLERMMMEFLDNHHIDYEFQKPCLIYKDKLIVQFFILDFYIPSKKIVIETDGKFHESQKEYDEYRTRAIEKQHPGVTVIRWRFKDFSSVKNMKKLLEILK